MEIRQRLPIKRSPGHENRWSVVIRTGNKIDTNQITDLNKREILKNVGSRFLLNHGFNVESLRVEDFYQNAHFSGFGIIRRKYQPNQFWISNEEYPILCGVLNFCPDLIKDLLQPTTWV